MESLTSDIRYALRTWIRNPGFTLVVVLTLALGVGATTTIFTLFEAVMLRTLPIQSPDDIFFVVQGGDRRVPGSNYPYFERFAARTDLFAGAAAYFRSGSVRVGAGAGVEIARGLSVSGTYYAVTGAPMALGRGLSPADDRPDASLAAVISDGYWSRKFGRDPQVLGRTLTIDGRPAVVVGVTTPGFSGLDPGSGPEITLPMAVRALDSPDFLTSHETWFGDMPIVVRLRSGVSPEHASAVVDAMLQQYRSEPENSWLFSGRSGPPVHASLMPAGRGTAGLRDQYAPSLQVLMAMVGVVLFIGCANVANLLLARGHARAKEMAVRISIGAGRARLVRQLLTESLLLALIGGALGLLLAQASVGAIGALVETGSSPVLLDLKPNAAVLAFTLIVSVLTGLVFGLAPAIGCTRLETAPALKSTGASTQRPGRRWSTRQPLVAAQIGLCVLLVSGAGLLARTLRNLETHDDGFDRHQLLLFSLDTRRTPFPAQQVPRLCDALAERLTSRGDVLSAACTRNIAMTTRGNARPLDVPGAPAQPPGNRLVFMNIVGPDYFRTLGIPVAAGRAFDARDSAQGERVAIINRSAARFFFGSDNPVGRSVHYFKDDAHPMTIVGVVEDSTQRTIREGSLQSIYTPLAQLAEPEGMVTMAVRTRSTPLTLAASIREEVRAVSPDVVVDNVRTMEQQIGATLVRERLVAMLSAAFGVLALVMSCIGLYGVIAYDVSRRVRDIGVRMALGAQRVDVIWQVLRPGFAMALVGIVAGLGATLAATRVLTTLLFEITPRDPLTLGGAAALLLLTALAASFIPARRASRVDPIVVLRTE